MIIVEFRYDRWEVIRRYGYRETLIGFRATKQAALELAAQYDAREVRSMRLPYSNFKEALERASQLAAFSGVPYYVNRLASSGAMRYEVSLEPITDTSFGAGVVHTALPPATRTVVGGRLVLPPTRRTK